MHPPRILNLFHAVLRTCCAVLVSILLMPGLARAAVFLPPAADLPATIAAPGINGILGLAGAAGESEIAVNGILTSIESVECSVWLTYPNIGMLALTLTSPTGITVVLADDEGQQDTGNDNGLGGDGGLNGGDGGGLTDTATLSIDSFRGQAVDTIPSGLYTCTTEPGWLTAGGYGFPENATNKLSKFKGLANLNVNGNWTLTVYNFDILFGGFAGETGGNQETGTINAWSLEIDEVGVHIWTGAAFGGFGPNWSLNGNWSNGAPTVIEQNVVLFFPSVAEQYIATNDIAGLTIGQVTFDANYTIAGDAVATTGNAIFLNEGGNTTWAIPLDLGAPQVGLFGPDGSTLQATGITIDVFGGQLTMSGVIGGGPAPGGDTGLGPTTITTEGPGTLVLSGNNTYGGITYIASGILDAQNANALGGAGNAGAFVATGATLQLGIPGAASPFAAFANQPLSISSVGVGAVGALEVVSPSAITIPGPLTLASSDAAVGAVAGGTLTLSALVGGGLTFEGQGTTSILNITEALPGATLIDNSGTVNLTIANAVPIFSVNGGGTVNAPAGLTVLQSMSSDAAATTNTFNGNLIIPNALATLSVAGGRANPSLMITGGTISGPGAIYQNGTGNCELDCTVGTPPLPYTVQSGALSGTAGLATLSVLSGAVVQPGTVAAGTGAMTTLGGASLAAGAVYVAQLWGGAPAQLNVGTILYVSGKIANGAGGAYISPYGGGAGTYTVITYANLTPSAFVQRPYPASTGITYGVAGQGGTADCIQLTLDGSTVALVNNSYTLSKGAGLVPIAVTWGGTVEGTASSDLVAVPGTAIQAQDFNQPTPMPLTEAAGTKFTLPIVQNYIAEGNTTFGLLLVPMGETTAAAGANNASVTIIDNENSGYQQKNCGVGSGFTVFFLFAIGLAMRSLYLRRR
jgi:autotransporter-associated beta strand protein